MAEDPKCQSCNHQVVTIEIMVDGHPLEMESCDNCDTRRWNLGGAEIDLGSVLEQVGEHAGRRR